MELLQPSSLDEPLGARQRSVTKRRDRGRAASAGRVGRGGDARRRAGSRPARDRRDAHRSGHDAGRARGRPGIPDALREACRLAASPQLRNMGSVAGNLLQSTRCWYWRLNFPCRLHGGDRVTRSRASTASTRSSATATARPRIRRTSPRRSSRSAPRCGPNRELAVADLYRLPTDDDRSLTDARAGRADPRARRPATGEEHVPEGDGAPALVVPDRRRRRGPHRAARRRIVLAGVAPVPWVLDSPEALADATPLPGTAYKVEIAEALVRRALEAVA